MAARGLSVDVRLAVSPDDQYYETLDRAATECVRACGLLPQVVLAIPLTSELAPNVHKLMWIIGNVETTLHQFIDRELLHNPYASRRENGARLQDAIESARNNLKPTVSGSLLAGGIASLLHLFAHLLVRLNVILQDVIDTEGSVNVSGLHFSSLAAAYVATSALPRRYRLTRHCSRGLISLLAAFFAARRVQQVWRAHALEKYTQRLSLTLQLWHLATSVLQRAHKAVASSYIELDQLDRRDVGSSPVGGLASSLGGIGNASGLSLNNLLHGGGGGGNGGMVPSRSYPQLIARPGQQDFDESHKTALRVMWETCVPWSESCFWWQHNVVLWTSKRLIDGYYGAYAHALRLVGLLPFAPESSAMQNATYLLASGLIPIYLAFPRFCADRVYHDVWIQPDIRMLQGIYAPLRWPLSIRIAEGTFGRDISHEEHRINNVRVVVMRPKMSSRTNGRFSSRSEPYPVERIPSRPTILFIPGGAFISDFEAPDRFFLYRWIRATSAILVYVTYEFAPQAPFPTQLEQVRAVYLALREHTHAAELGFKATPLVVSGLSAGGNLATAALLYPLLQPRPPAPLATSDVLAERRAAEDFMDSDNLRMPDALLLICPTLNICRSPSPSRLAFSADPLLPQPLLYAFASAYDGYDPVKNVDENTFHANPIQSPVFAPDDVLARLPPTSIQVGGFDPLLDDSVDFNTRIRRLRIPGLHSPLAGELKIYRELPHTFVSFPHWHMLPQVKKAMHQACEWLNEWLHGLPSQYE